MGPYEEDDWTRVSYRRGRQRNRRESPPARRTYASVTRGDRQPPHRQHSPCYSHRSRGDRRRRHRSPSFQGDESRHPHSRRDTAERYRRPRDRDSCDRSPRPRRDFNSGGRDPGRRENRQQRPSHTQGAHTHNPNWVQSDDPHFTFKVRIIYRIIKSNHHLKNVSGTDPPPIIRRTTTNLAKFIKPASPNDTTQILLEGNARNWEHSALLILKQHYEENMSNDIQDLAEFPSSEWEGPFQVASAWAKKNLGPRLKAKSLHDTEAFLKANLSVHIPEKTADIPPDPTPITTATAAAPAPPGRPVTVQAQTHTVTTTVTPAPDEKEKEQIPPPLPPPPRPPSPPSPPLSILSQEPTGDDAEETVTMATAITARAVPACPPPPPHNPCVLFGDQEIQTEASPGIKAESAFPRLTPRGFQVPSTSTIAVTPLPGRRSSQGTVVFPCSVIPAQPPEEVQDLLHLEDPQPSLHTPLRRLTRHTRKSFRYCK